MNIELTEDEIIMILDCIGARIEDLQETLAWTPDCGESADQLSALADLDMDLREQSNRRDDGWNDEVTETFTTNLVQSAIDDWQSKVTSSSKAASRRQARWLGLNRTTNKGNE